MPNRKATACPAGHPYDEANTYHYAGKQHCRTCRREHVRVYSRENPDKRRKLELSWRQDPKNAEAYRIIKLREHAKRRFGLTLDEYLAIIDRGCAVCGTTDRVGVDHDHTTGKVRDALCVRCNASLGMAGDDADRLRALADYLDTHRGE